ncbi:MAG: radical SAM protein [Phycisphaerae bacterium]|nr:B12-binding domain-containing radical SAM protein [Phycisphaerae bacterium]NIT57835.1 B12-binding domain-containing radical SAM protein [Fodinibius sp.]NIU58799.1 radical SAM protein [Phycisphaerae bacterium]NIV12708.1 radical SAM protein [Fodinibius sp.]NIW95072.1 radical SAM protein [Phycisphaerae bacterium]
MKISLITPPRIAISPRDAVRIEGGVPHPGILCIAEFLLSHGIDTTILDLNVLPAKGSDNEIIDYLTKEKPEVVGLTALTCNYPHMVRIAGLVRRIARDIKIIVGGVHIALNHVDILNSSDAELFDFLVYGEGEQATLEIIRHLDGVKSLEKIRGICYKGCDGYIVKNPPVENMLRPPIIRKAWELLDIPKYANNGKGFGLSFNTMRGCYGHCNFCSEPLRWSGVQMMTAEDIVTQFRYLNDRFDPDYILIGDSNFNLSTERIKKFVELMESEDLSIPFIFGGRADKIWEQRELLPELRERGAFLIFIGGERMAEDDLSYIGKDLSPCLVEQAALAVHESGIGLETMFIFGLPFDTEESMKTQARLIQERIRPEIPSFASYTPIPGTPEYQRGVKYIRIHDLTYYTFNNSVCDTDFINRYQVDNIINGLWLNYWMRKDNRDNIMNHSNETTRMFCQIYYDNF